jgi:hypothetical protein
MSEIEGRCVDSVIKWVPWKKSLLKPDRLANSMIRPDKKIGKSLRFGLLKASPLKPLYPSLRFPKLSPVSIINSTVTHPEDLSPLHSVPFSLETVSFPPDPQSDPDLQRITLKSYKKPVKKHSNSSLSPKKSRFSRLSPVFASVHARSPGAFPNLSSSISRKLLFPPLHRSQLTSITPDPLPKPSHHDANINTDTFYEENWLQSKYF